MAQRLAPHKLIPVLKGNRAFVNPGMLKEWQERMHEMAGQTYLGRDLEKTLAYNLLTRLDPAMREQLAASMRKTGMSEARIEKGMAEMDEFTDLKFKERTWYSVSEQRGMVLWASSAGPSGFLLQSDKPLGEPSSRLCVIAEFTQLMPFDYKSPNNPSVIKADSKLSEAINSYRKNRRFGVMAFGVIKGGSAIVILGNPEIQTVVNNGVALLGTNSTTQPPEELFELLLTQYSPQLSKKDLRSK